MQTKPPVISVIVPTYNRADLLPRALDSILNQIHRPDEIIVVDDGSEDETPDVVAAYGDLIVYHYQDNRGVSAARNTGVGIASSPWVAFLDSDDYWDEGFLERVVVAMEETDLAADVYFSDMVYPEEPDPALRSLWDQANFVVEEPYRLVEDGTEWVLMPLQPFRMQTSVLNRARYLASGGGHESLRIREDQYFFLSFGLGASMCVVKGVAVFVGEDASNRVTNIYQGHQWMEAYVTIYGDLVNRHDLPDDSKVVLRQRYGETFYSLAIYDLNNNNLPGFVSNLMRGIRNYPQGFIKRFRNRVKSTAKRRC